MTNFRIILGSQSPRRIELIRALGFEVEVRIQQVEEVFPEDLSPEDVPEYLANQKAKPLLPSLKSNELLVTADTIVICEGKILGKPGGEKEAIQMLNFLSGKKHQVITGVGLGTTKRFITFREVTNVYFSCLKEEQISHYVKHYQPFDKAGSYGIQEWIGYIGIEGIEGCYYNVMGLPLHRLYKEIEGFKEN